MRKFSTFAKLICKNAQMNNWDDLRYFLELARCGSLSGASRELGVNHSTVARRIASLEKKHGVKLFNRQPNGYQLTEAGDVIYQHALEIEQQNQTVERLLYAGDTRLSGKLVVTMPHELANHCIIPYLQDFTAKYPDVDLELVVSPGLKNLSAREADIAVRVTPAPPEALVGQKLANLRHAVYFSKQHPQVLAEQKIIIWRQDTNPPAWAQQHFPNAKVVLKVDDLASMYAAVKVGIGIARMPCYLPDSVLDTDIFKLDLALTPSDWGIWVLHHADLRETARVRAFKKFLIERLQVLRPLFEGERGKRVNTAKTYN
ncbi:LysR family transcriptional regulator [Saccharophagus degradans]|nr:LysR family transcriptional regulator [Saccharophagus degradans]